MCCDTALKGEATAVLPPCCSTSRPPAGVSSTLGSVRWRIRERFGRRGGREAIWVEQHEALWLYPLMRCRVGKKILHTNYTYVIRAVSLLLSLSHVCKHASCTFLQNPPSPQRYNCHSAQPYVCFTSPYLFFSPSTLSSILTNSINTLARAAVQMVSSFLPIFQFFSFPPLSLPSSSHPPFLTFPCDW